MKQEKWAQAEMSSVVSHEEIASMINNEMEGSELEGAFKTIAEQVRRCTYDRIAYVDAYIMQRKLIGTLRFQVTSLKSSRYTLTQENMEMNQELKTIREKMEESSTRISLLQGELEQSNVALNAKIGELKKKNDAMKVKEEEVSQLMERLGEVSNEAEEVKTAYIQEVARGEGLNTQVADANKRIQELTAR